MKWDDYSGFLLTYKQWLEIGIIVVLTFIVTRIIKLVMRRYVNRSSAYLKIDKTRLRFFGNAINGVIFVFAAISIIHTIPALRSISTTLFASAGILAAVIGFASQQAVSNIVGGVFVVIFRPFRVGDNIKVGNDLSGIVEDITLRHTILKDAENARIVIPNSLINNQTVINYDIIDSKYRKKILFNVPLENSIDKAISILKEEVYKHPLILKDKHPDKSSIQIDVYSITDKFITLRVLVWTKNVDDAAKLSFDLNHSVFVAFNENGIKLSEPQTIVINQG